METKTKLDNYGNYLIRTFAGEQLRPCVVQEIIRREPNRCPKNVYQYDY